MKQNMSSPSPVTDGRHVWVMTGTGMLSAFDFAGNQVWTRDVQKDYGRFGIMHGYAASPLLHDDALYVPVLHGMMTDDPSYILRIDTATGQTVWRVERPTHARFESPDAYTTPALLNHAGGTEVVVTGRRCRDRPRPGNRRRSCGAPRASIPPTRATTGSSRLPSCTAICCSRRRASGRCWR